MDGALVGAGSMWPKRYGIANHELELKVPSCSLHGHAFFIANLQLGWKYIGNEYYEDRKNFHI